MRTRLGAGVICTAVLAATPAFPGDSGPRSNDRQAPAPATQAQAAPATRLFAADAGLVLNFIKPDKAAQFEAIIAKLKEALQKSEKPERRQQAASWKVYKSPDPGAGGLAVYIFFTDPVVKGADYTISTILSESLPDEATTIIAQYSECFASGQNWVNLKLIADLGK